MFHGLDAGDSLEVSVDEEDVEDESEYELDFAQPLDTLSCPDGEVFFLHGVASFCEQHEAKAVMVAHGAVWLLPADGGKWYDVQDHGRGAERRPLRPVN